MHRFAAGGPNDCMIFQVGVSGDLKLRFLFLAVIYSQKINDILTSR